MFEMRFKCNKPNTTKISDLSFWVTFTMKEEPWQWTLDASSKVEKSDLLRPQTENYRAMKAQIEKAVSDSQKSVAFHKF